MSRILVIEPNRMLQQAIALSLFPNHEVKLTESLADLSDLKGFDVVIVDAASLRESNGLGAAGIRAVESWTVPTIWVEPGEGLQLPGRKNLVVIDQPIENTALQSALAECLGAPSTTARREGMAGQDQQVQSRSMGKARGKTVKAMAATKAAKFIELVDVVEEGAEPQDEKTSQEKK